MIREQKNDLDYGEWLRRDIWNINEAIFLLMGIEPGVNVEAFSLPQEVSDNYFKILETAKRAKGLSLHAVDIEGNDDDDDYFYVEPKKFIQWALDKGYEIPVQLNLLTREEEPNRPIGSQTDFEKALSELASADNIPSLLEIAIKAWQKVWISNELGSNPKSKNIIPWLDNEYFSHNGKKMSNVGSNKAKLVDQMIRPDKQKEGALSKNDRLK